MRWRPRVAKWVCFLVEEWADARKEGVANIASACVESESELRQGVVLAGGRLRGPRRISVRQDTQRPLSWKDRDRPARQWSRAIRRERGTPTLDAPSQFSSSGCSRYARTKVPSGAKWVLAGGTTTEVV